MPTRPVKRSRENNFDCSILETAPPAKVSWLGQMRVKFYTISWLIVALIMAQSMRALFVGGKEVLCL
jgi:hypothetical protein